MDSNALRFYRFFAQVLHDREERRGAWEANLLTTRAQVFEALEASWRRMTEEERAAQTVLGETPAKYKREKICE